MAQRRGRTEKFIDDIVQRVVENELGRAGRGCQSCLAPILDEQKCIFFFWAGLGIGFLDELDRYVPDTKSQAP